MIIISRNSWFIAFNLYNGKMRWFDSLLRRNFLTVFGTGTHQYHEEFQQLLVCRGNYNMKDEDGRTIEILLKNGFYIIDEILPGKTNWNFYMFLRKVLVLQFLTFYESDRQL